MLQRDIEVLWLCTHYYTIINFQVKAKEEGVFISTSGPEYRAIALKPNYF